MSPHLESIHGVPPDVHNGDVYPDIPSEFFINEIDVYRKLSTTLTLKSAEPGLIPNWVLKCNPLILILPKASILNASIEQSLVPIIWKRADVIPV